MEWQVTERDGDLEIHYGGELFGVLLADDRGLIGDEDALTEWVEQELLAHAERLTAVMRSIHRPDG